MGARLYALPFRPDRCAGAVSRERQPAASGGSRTGAPRGGPRHRGPARRTGGPVRPRRSEIGERVGRQVAIGVAEVPGQPELGPARPPPRSTARPRPDSKNPPTKQATPAAAQARGGLDASRTTPPSRPGLRQATRHASDGQRLARTRSGDHSDSSSADRGGHRARPGPGVRPGRRAAKGCSRQREAVVVERRGARVPSPVRKRPVGVGLNSDGLGKRGPQAPRAARWSQPGSIFTRSRRAPAPTAASTASRRRAGLALGRDADQRAGLDLAPDRTESASTSDRPSALQDHVEHGHLERRDHGPLPGRCARSSRSLDQGAGAGERPGAPRRQEAPEDPGPPRAGSTSSSGRIGVPGIGGRRALAPARSSVRHHPEERRSSCPSARARRCGPARRSASSATTTSTPSTRTTPVVRPLRPDPAVGPRPSRPPPPRRSGPCRFRCVDAP